jgi:hypothetical protein
VKYFIGVPFTILVVLVALSPLLLFAILKYIGDETTGVRLEMSISLEGYPVSVKKLVGIVLEFVKYQFFSKQTF